jgi:hypothetical protein
MARREVVVRRVFGEADVAEPGGGCPVPGGFLAVDLFKLTGTVHTCWLGEDTSAQRLWIHRIPFLRSQRRGRAESAGRS